MNGDYIQYLTVARHILDFHSFSIPLIDVLNKRVNFSLKAGVFILQPLYFLVVVVEVFSPLLYLLLE